VKNFTKLAIEQSDGLVFGVAPKPVPTRAGLVIGGGTVYPELNFTLPVMLLNEQSFTTARQHYRQMATEALARAADLSAPGVVMEFETVPAMTEKPEWAIDLCKLLLDCLADAHAKTHLPAALRMTPNDNREMVRPPVMRSGRHLQDMMDVFQACAEAGAELLSVESAGGKEVHDEAIVAADIRQAIFALCVMGVRDMEFIWTRIAGIAAACGVHPAGDTACGFANTAMVLADRKMIPRVFAAVDRAVSAVRSLVAYQCGAVGPGKDCAYENPFLKAITGCPMSMEGKSAACAHLSPLGNLPMAYGDLWSNESVQNVKLLGGMAPTVSMEQLTYDCRLLNRASADGRQGALKLRDWLVDSDAPLDPQAYILAPDNVISIARTIIGSGDHYQAGRETARKAIEILRHGRQAGRVRIEARELTWLDMMASAVDSMPQEQDEFTWQMMKEVDTSKFIPAEYGLD